MCKVKDFLKRNLIYLMLLLAVLFLPVPITSADGMMHIQPLVAGLWENVGNTTRLITPYDIDIQNMSLLNVLGIDGVNITALNGTVSGHTTAIISLQSDMSDAQADIIDNTDDITALKNIAIVFIIDGGGGVITTGIKGHLDIPFDCSITGWILLADKSGSIVIDVWKDTYANFPPTVADTIAGSEKPTLSAVQKNQDLSLGTWTTSITAGDILAFNVDSCSTITRITLTILATRI